MPGGDRTGPRGEGPMTGRGMGYCAGYSVPGYMDPSPRLGLGRRFGRGIGRGFGRGFGWRRFDFAPAEPIWQPQPIYPQQPQPQLTKEQEMQMLEQEAKAIEDDQKILKEELSNIRKRIDEIKAKK